MYTVYILECSDGTLYTGITNNLEKRFKRHQSGDGGHYTRSKQVVKIVYTEEQPDKSSALKREALIKSWRREKKLTLLMPQAHIRRTLVSNSLVKYTSMQSCITCSMPFVGNHAGDIALETLDGPVCKFDVMNGKIKSPEEIFEGGVEFYTHTCTSGDRDLAARLTRRNMRSLPYWKKHPSPVLDGEEATDEEHEEAMQKFMEHK